MRNIPRCIGKTGLVQKLFISAQVQGAELQVSKYQRKISETEPTKFH